MSDPIQASKPTTSTHPPGDGETPRPQLVAKGWTMGNSATLVEGSEREPRWVSVAWFVVPAGVALAMLLAMAYFLGS